MIHPPLICISFYYNIIEILVTFFLHNIGGSKGTPPPGCAAPIHSTGPHSVVFAHIFGPPKQEILFCPCITFIVLKQVSLPNRIDIHSCTSMSKHNYAVKCPIRFQGQTPVVSSHSLSIRNLCLRDEEANKFIEECPSYATRSTGADPGFDQGGVPRS